MSYVLLGLLVVLIGVVLYRTFRFKLTPLNYEKVEHAIDGKRIVESLSKMIQIPTVSYTDSAKTDQKAFTDFKNFLKNRYPKINSIAEYQELLTGVLFKIKGDSSEKPVVLMAHFDVVPVVGDWQDNPFSGKISDTHVYGRGTLDTKNSLNSIMEALEHHLNQGHSFRNDLYIAFSGEEEINGPTAPYIVNYFKENKIEPYLVLDEGGAIVSKMFPGVSNKCAVVGIAEKGFLNLKLVAHSKGGHASSPPSQTPLTELAEAILSLNNHPSFKLKLTPSVRALFNQLAPYSKSFPIRMLFANLWLFLPIVKWIAKKSGGEFLAMFKTTQAFTIAEGSEAYNVLPATASIGINYRLRPEETSDEVIKRIKNIIAHTQVDLEVISVFEPVEESLIDEGFALVEQSIYQTWPEVLVAPYLMVATSDSRHYHEICKRVYKFSPMDVSKADLAKIHGIDEDITIENVLNGVRFYLNLLDKL